jgi:cupin fold WbuC family metalloprotein
MSWSKYIRDMDLQNLINQATCSPRGRSHLLLHNGHEDGVQRLLIAAQPGTYVRPHQHSEQWEMLVLIKGCLDVLELNDVGAVLGRRSLDANSPLIEIPQSTWHTCVVRHTDTVILEVKPGPYRPNEFASWAPEESSAGTNEVLGKLEKGIVGSKLSNV